MCGLTVIYSRIMGTAAWRSRRAAASVLSRGTQGAPAPAARCSLSITAAPPGDSPGADVSRAASPCRPAVTHVRAAEKPSPRLLMCCDQTMCICPNSVRFRWEELSWPMALMERHPVAAGESLSG